MEQLEQIDLNCISAPECAKTEVCIEEIEKKLEILVDFKEHKKPVRSRLSKLFKKSKLNAKYLEELIPIEKLNYQQPYRDYRMY